MISLTKKHQEIIAKNYDDQDYLEEREGYREDFDASRSERPGAVKLSQFRNFSPKFSELLSLSFIDLPLLSGEPKPITELLHVHDK